MEKIFAGHCALSIETLDVDAGEIVAVVGPTGCGKTLFINILAGAVPASGGSMLLDGQWIHRRASGVSLPLESRLQLGVLFADDLLYERHTVRGNLEFSCRWSRLPLSFAGDMLKQVGLSDQAQQAVARLSPPAKRRLAFARALLATHGCYSWINRRCADPETQAVFARLLQEAAANGSLVLFTEEDLTWAGSWCSRAIELQDGHVAERLVMSGSPDMPGSVPEKLAPFRVPARREDRVMLYDPAEILYATSRDGKTYLRTAREEALNDLPYRSWKPDLVDAASSKRIGPIWSTCNMSRR